MSEAGSAVTRVWQALDEAGITARVMELPASTHTSVEAAQAVGCAVEQIAQSVVFRRADTGGAVLVVLRGVDRVDTKALAAHLGGGIERAAPSSSATRPASSSAASRRSRTPQPSK